MISVEFRWVSLDGSLVFDGIGTASKSYEQVAYGDDNHHRRLWQICYSWRVSLPFVWLYEAELDSPASPIILKKKTLKWFRHYNNPVMHSDKKWSYHHWWGLADTLTPIRNAVLIPLNVWNIKYYLWQIFRKTVGCDKKKCAKKRRPKRHSWARETNVEYNYLGKFDQS